MKIGVHQLAIFVLVSVTAKPIQACQPEFYANTVFELDDGEHVFAIKYREDVKFEYPASGVYRKEPDKQLVWEYEGIGFSSDSDLSDSFSSTGKYFVETNFRILEEDELGDPSNDQRVVLSIYNKGKLIGEFSRETFIYGEFLRQNIRQHLSEIVSGKRVPMNCWPRLWGHMEYDKLIDQIKVRSIANRTVVIDVPTAEILYVDEYDVYEYQLDESEPSGLGTPDTVQDVSDSPVSLAENEIQIASLFVELLDLEKVITVENPNVLINLLSQAIDRLQSGDITDAIQKLESAISRTDGCILRGIPDGNGHGRDWIFDCSAQTQIYEMLNDALIAIEQ